MVTSHTFMEFSPYTFDTRAFVFSLKCLVVLSVLFFGVRYGTVLAEDRIVSEQLKELAPTELQIEEIKARRTLRSIGEVKVLQELQEFEKTLSTRTIGTASADTIAAAHERMIAADLTSMKLYLFEGGYATATIPILSKGKRGSRWETPTGLYKIETKETDHFSSIGEVHMPYSMQFFGNFFIHGWPYYPDGTPVPEGYSGGCIRLSTEDATRVFEFAKNGMPIFISEETETPEALPLIFKSLPPVSARAFLVADIHSGVVYAEQDADMSLPIASLSKLLTALVANETIHYDRTLTLSAEDRVHASTTPGSLPAGDTFTVGGLLFPLLMESNNAVANTFARYHGTPTFVKWMNDKARAIGMDATHMDDPSGLSARNTSTANDLFKLARYIRTSQSYILNISREPKKTISNEEGREYVLANFNHFADTEGFLGGKTGYTDEARQTMVALFEERTPHGTSTIVYIVLGADNRKKDIEQLRAWFQKSAR